jgi:release factor glutamine methyltransferase
MTVHERVAAARARLGDAGLSPAEAELDARLLAQYALGWDAARLAASAGEPEPAGFTAAFEALIVRRAAREPLAYITGRREFWSLDIEVSPAVLIPRPETELIVEHALERFSNRDVPIEIADVGTGSGCLAVALAHERPRSRVLALDVSDSALEVARRNGYRHGVADRIDFARADLLGATNRQFDLIVSNPPYVPDRDRPTLQPEIRDYEPATALFAADDGLSVVRRLVAQSATHLKFGGVLIFEFGYGQADAVTELIRLTNGLVLLELVNDLQGIPRVAAVARQISAGAAPSARSAQGL